MPPESEVPHGPEAIDEAILAQLAARIRATATAPDLDEDARRSHITRLKARAAELGLSSYFIGRLFAEIGDYAAHERNRQAVTSQNPALRPVGQLRVAYQGTEGAYSHLAIRQYFSHRLDSLVPVGYPTFQAAFRAVEDGEVDFAMLPIENTIAGSINETYEALAHTRLVIVGEEAWRVEHCLLAPEPTPLSHIRRIHSHPVALQQCSQFLQTLPHVTLESFIDTAAAARRVREEGDVTHAAIASEEAAALYGLTVVKRDIANSHENFTRFVLVGREALQVDPSVPCKTSLLLVTNHEEGALVKALSCLRDAAVNMTKLESRPLAGAPWEYQFYIDIEGHAEAAPLQQALDAMRQNAIRLRVLGSYPRHARTGPAVDTGDAPPPVPLPRSKPTGDAVTPAPRPGHAFRLASREAHPEPSVFRIGTVEVGRGRTVIAGPCAVESREQILEAAHLVKECGAAMLRGGVFKPRSSPYSFQGLGYAGLEYLREAGDRYGLPVVTEVVSPEQVGPLADAVDVLQIGARNMQNFALLKEVGLTGKPVFLKRGMMASVEEWLLAAEYILAQGNQQVMLCERGIRSFETATRNTLDLAAVPVVHAWSHLPVFVDPSHAVGVREWIPILAIAAAAAGADGLMIEVHPDPEGARCDKAQALTPDDFQKLMAALRRVPERTDAEDSV